MRTLLNEGENSFARSLGRTITCSLDGSAPSAVRPRGQQLAQPDFEKRRLGALGAFEFKLTEKEGVGAQEAQLEYEAKRKYSRRLGGEATTK